MRAVFFFGCILIASAIDPKVLDAKGAVDVVVWIFTIAAVMDIVDFVVKNFRLHYD